MIKAIINICFIAISMGHLTPPILRETSFLSPDKTLTKTPPVVPYGFLQ